MGDDLAQRIAKLEAIEDIKKLKSRYAQACDDSYNPETMRTIFSKDAVWNGGDAFGRFDGQDAICQFFAEVSSQITWALHYMMAPEIEVADDAKTATGTWYIWMPFTAATDDGPQAAVGGWALQRRVPARAGGLAHLEPRRRPSDHVALRRRLGEDALDGLDRRDLSHARNDVAPARRSARTRRRCGRRRCGCRASWLAADRGRRDRHQLARGEPRCLVPARGRYRCHSAPGDGRGAVARSHPRRRRRSAS